MDTFSSIALIKHHLNNVDAAIESFSKEKVLRTARLYCNFNCSAWDVQKQENKIGTITYNSTFSIPLFEESNHEVRLPTGDVELMKHMKQSPDSIPIFTLKCNLDDDYSSRTSIFYTTIPDKWDETVFHLEDCNEPEGSPKWKLSCNYLKKGKETYLKSIVIHYVPSHHKTMIDELIRKAIRLQYAKTMNMIRGIEPNNSNS